MAAASSVFNSAVGQIRALPRGCARQLAAWVALPAAWRAGVTQDSKTVLTLAATLACIELRTGLIILSQPTGIYYYPGVPG